MSISEPVVRIHSFQPALQESEKLELSKKWLPAFRQQFAPKNILGAIQIVVKCQGQQRGVDWHLLFDDGSSVNIDTKMRRPDCLYTDIALEIYSQCQVNRTLLYTQYREELRKKRLCLSKTEFEKIFYNVKQIGWALDEKKICDWIAYVIPSHHLCYWLPYKPLRELMQQKWREWVENGGQGIAFPIPAYNNGYCTLSIGVSFRVLKQYCQKISREAFVKEIDLPSPYLLQQMLLFEQNSLQ